MQDYAPNRFPNKPWMEQKAMGLDLDASMIRWNFDPYNPHNPFGPFYEPYQNRGYYHTLKTHVFSDYKGKHFSAEKKKFLNDAIDFYIARGHGCHPTVDLNSGWTEGTGGRPNWNAKPNPYGKRNHCHMEGGELPSIHMDTYLKEVSGCVGTKECWNTIDPYKVSPIKYRSIQDKLGRNSRFELHKNA